jgi:hypothetical protein
MRRRLLLPALGVLLLALAGLGVMMTTASAHTPSVGGDCSGVHASGTGYEPGDSNTVTVTVDGQTETQSFSTSGSVSLPIPQDGKEHTWSASVTTSNADPAFSASTGGTLTCGTPPPPPPTPTVPSDTPTPTVPVPSDTPTPTPTDTPEPTEPTLIPPTSTAVPPPSEPDAPMYETRQTHNCAYLYTSRWVKKDGEPWKQLWAKREPTGNDCGPGTPYAEGGPTEEGM